MTRITCPACGTAYEVPASAIPHRGREVQCSACQHCWFQMSIAPRANLEAPDAAGEQRFANLRARLAAEVARVDEPGPAVAATLAEGGARSADAAPDPTPPPPKPEEVPDWPQAVSPFATEDEDEEPEGPEPQAPVTMPREGPMAPGSRGSGPDAPQIAAPILRPAPTSPLTQAPPVAPPQMSSGQGPAPTDPAPGPSPMSVPFETGPPFAGSVPPRAAPSAPPPPAEPSKSAVLKAFAPHLSQEGLVSEPPPRREVDPEVLAVLRSEAAFESEARRRASQPLETQGELPLPPVPTAARGRDLRDRLAQMQALQEATGAAAPQPEARPETPSKAGPAPERQPRERLTPEAGPRPETARPRSREHIEAAAPGRIQAADRRLPAPLVNTDLALYEAQQQRRGFRIGFALPLVIAAACLGLYLGAPAVIEHVPQSAAALAPVLRLGDGVQADLADAIWAAIERLTPVRPGS